MSSPSIENLDKSAIIRYIPKQFRRAYPFSLYTNRHVLYRGKRASPRNPVCISVFGPEGATCPEYSVPACAAEARCKYAPKGFSASWGCGHRRGMIYMVSALGRYHINALHTALGAPSWEYPGRFFCRHGPTAGALRTAPVKFQPLGPSTGRYYPLGVWNSVVKSCLYL